MAVRPRIGPSGGELASGGVQDFARASVVRWTARTTLVVAAVLAVIFGVADVVAIRTSEYQSTSYTVAFQICDLT